MEENDLFHCNRTMEYDLIYICSPGRISLVAQLVIEFQIRLSLGQARWSIQSCIRPSLGPFGKKQVVNLVGRNEMPYGADALEGRGEIPIVHSDPGQLAARAAPVPVPRAIALGEEQQQGASGAEGDDDVAAVTHHVDGRDEARGLGRTPGASNQVVELGGHPAQGGERIPTDDGNAIPPLSGTR